MSFVKIISVIIPCFNEGVRLLATLKNIESELVKISSTEQFQNHEFCIVVVDDGSRESSRAMVDLFRSKISVKCFYLEHKINLGQGAALQTGIDFSRLKLNAEYFVTMDADGQHDPEGLSVIARPVMCDEVDIAFGNRFANGLPEGIPVSRRILLSFAATFEKCLTGLSLSDAHNGFRFFNRTSANKIKLRQNRMAHATEFKQIVKREKLRYAECPVRIKYSSESLEKGQSNLGTLVIVKDLFGSFLFRG
jgi:polyprenyl-phospho-N-acetylgalactosaminyl synthase